MAKVNSKLSTVETNSVEKRSIQMKSKRTSNAPTKSTLGKSTSAPTSVPLKSKQEKQTSATKREKHSLPKQHSARSAYKTLASGATSKSSISEQKSALVKNASTNKATFNATTFKLNPKVGLNRRQDVLQQLREKLKNTKSGVEKSTKTGKGAKPVDGTSAGDGSTRAGFNALSMSQIETHIQSFTLRFIDLIIGCMVIDNYIFGVLILLASIAQIAIGWLYLDECSAQPILPYLLIANGVINIIVVHLRNLANQRLIDYFVMSVFRLLALFSFVTVFINVLTVDPSMTIWSLPSNSVYASVDGLVYCSTVLYHFSYYLCLVGGSFIWLLSAYGIGCIAYMVYSTGGRRIHDSRLSSSGGSSKGGSAESAAKASKH